MSKQITIIAAENVHAPMQVIASLAIGHLIEGVKGIDRAMDEDKPKDTEGRCWPDTRETTACDYTLRAIRDRLNSMVGKTFDDMGELLWETYHAMEPLKLIAIADPKTSYSVTNLVDSVFRDYEVLCGFLEGISTPIPTALKTEPEVRRAARRANKEASHA